MSETPISVLLVESNGTDAALVQSALAGEGNRFRVQCVAGLPEALEWLGRERVEVVLLDLVLPEDAGRRILDRVSEAAPDALIVVLSEVAGEDAARQAEQRGVDDVFVKGHMDAHWLPRALNYLLDRKASRAALRASEGASGP